MKDHSPRIVITMSFCIFTLALSILAIGFLKTELIKPLFTSLSYPIMFLLTGFWLYRTMMVFNLFNLEILKLNLIKYRLGMLTSFLITAFIFISSPVYFKTLSDETNLLSVSKSFQSEKTPFNVTMGKYYYDNFNPINREIPTRPLLFPFVTSLFHDFLGFHYQNVFILNFLTLASLFFLSYFTAYAFTSNETIAVSAIFLVASFPVFSIYGTGGGFDLFSTLFYGLSLWALWHFLKSKTAESFLWLCLTVLMFANIRYESIVAILIIFFALIITRQIRMPHLIQNALPISICSFFILPFAFQRYLTQGQYENPPGTPVIGFSAFKEHFGIFLRALDISDFSLPYNLIVLVFGLISFPYLISRLFSEKKPTHFKIFLSISILVFLALNFIFFAHHFGVFTHPTQSRFFMILSLFAALSVILAITLHPDLVRPRIVLFLSIGFFVLYHNISTEGRFINSLTMIRETRYIHKFLENLKDRNILVVTDRPGQYTALDYGAINFGYANQNSAEILGDANRSLIKNVYFFQQVAYKNDLPFDNQSISPNYNLKEIARFQISADYYIKTSIIENKIDKTDVERSSIKGHKL